MAHWWRSPAGCLEFGSQHSSQALLPADTAKIYLQNASCEIKINLSSCPEEEGRDGQEKKLWHLTYTSMEVSHVLDKQPHCREGTLKETKRDTPLPEKIHLGSGQYLKEKTGDQREMKSSEWLRNDLQTTKNYVSKASIKDTVMPRA